MHGRKPNHLRTNTYIENLVSQHTLLYLTDCNFLQLLILTLNSPTINAAIFSGTEDYLKVMK